MPEEISPDLVEPSFNDGEIIFHVMKKPKKLIPKAYELILGSSGILSVNYN